MESYAFDQGRNKEKKKQCSCRTLVSFIDIGKIPF